MADLLKQKRKMYVKTENGIQEQLVASAADIVEVNPIEGLDGVTDVQGALEAIAGIATEGGVTGVKGDAETEFRKGQVNITKTNIGLGNVTNDAQVKRSEMGKASGVATLGTDGKVPTSQLPNFATLGSDGKVPTSQLPSYVDDVIEGTYVSATSFKNTSGTAVTGEAGKIYVDTDTNKTYRWSGSTFVEISSSLALGETSSTAYAGDKGKKNADDIADIIDGTITVAKATNAGHATSADSATTAGSADTAGSAGTADKLKTARKITIEGDASGEVSFDGSADKKLSLTLANSGVTAGTYSAVAVDAKGRVTAGNQIIEWGSSGQTTPTANLAVGGLFFELVE